MTQQFNKIPTADESLNRIQENIRMALDPISTDIIFNRQEISAIVGISSKVIQHNLGRVPRGFIIVDKTAISDVRRVAWDSTTITLASNGLTTIKFWLF